MSRELLQSRITLQTSLGSLEGQCEGLRLKNITETIQRARLQREVVALTRDLRGEWKRGVHKSPPEVASLERLLTTASITKVPLPKITSSFKF